MQGNSTHRFYTLLIVAITCFVAAIFLNEGFEDSQTNLGRKSRQLQYELQKLTTKTEEFNKLITGNIQRQRTSNIDQCIPPFDLHHIDKQWYSLLIFRHESLSYWSDNRISSNYNDILKVDNHDVVFLNNGWYQVFIKNIDDIKLVGLLCLKTEYKITNKLLPSEFNPALHAEGKISIIKSRSFLKAYPIYSSNNKYLFSLNYDKVDVYTPTIIPLLYLFGLLCLFFYLFEFLSHYRKKNKLMVYLVLAGLVVARILMYIFHIPKGLYSLELFNPALFAGYYSLRSLGDLLLSIVVLVFCMIFIYQDIASVRITPRVARGNIFYALILSPAFFITFLYSILIHYLQYNLIFNSKISLEVNNLFELNWYSYMVMFIIFVLMFSYFLLTDAIIKSIIGSYRDWKFHAVVLLAAMACFLLFVNNFLPSEIYKTYDYTTFILAVVIIVLLYFFRNRKSKLFSFFSALTVITVFSFYTAYLVNNLHQEKEISQRKLIANKIAEKKDPIAEYLFSENFGKQNNDRILISYFDKYATTLPADKEIIPLRIINRINQLFFTDAYWSKYDIDYYLFDSARNDLGQGGTMQGMKFDDLQQMIDSSTQATTFKELYQIKNFTTRNAYIGSIVVLDQQKPDSIKGYVFTFMREKLGGAKKGFPQLLERENNQPIRGSSFDKYSWAFYKNNILSDKGGKYNFDGNLLHYTSGNVNRAMYYVRVDNVLHLVHRLSPTDVLLVTLTDNVRFKLFTESTYWFTYFFVLFLVFWIVLRLITSKLNVEFSFKNRIQISVMLIVVLSMVLIGGFTVYFINGNYKVNQRLQLLEKLNSLQLVIENEFHNSNLHEMNSDLTLPALARISNAMDCDFTFYNTSGTKVYSTKPTMFSLHIIGPLMNREAFGKLTQNATNSFVQAERIGNLNYLSSYTGLYDSNNVLMGYLNLPYITDSDELKNQISEFIITLVNIYVPLFLLCLLLTFFTANQLAKPLKTLQVSMAKVRLGRTTEPILWDKSDEIGALIKQYNKMVDELAMSANKLARSERESAWREMAKQVAHEIKNPLTPIKLSVQHLQRAWQDQSPNLDQIVPRLSASIIEQIDTLSAIATEFSNFAKMPTAHFTVVELNSLIKSSLELFAKDGNAIIENLVPENGVYKVFADKEQLLRVLSNLLKNAMQSVPETREGVITVNINSTKTHYTLTINDNGKGIKKEEQSKIFVPYFTTKSFGTGLGLAIVKNIVEAANGTIWFESEEGKGSTFFVQLPRFRDIND